ncbi:exodeoxyribonuclease VII large subunit [uncultured Selenomonas sp.]|uniref:exodeoxyribonuclease VII large subunit n=1 Tax=uncultured Selenomonas sp. TaxID=159275 RepID=UPI0025D38287|nr:exodeoxyribonuclease VII large subunit [uncultured Selenomonas sp.]
MAIHEVSDVNRYIKRLLGTVPALKHLMVRGEVSNFKVYASGHAYFTLKDAASQLKCVMFRSRAQYLTFHPENGQAVIASGRIDVYERDGVYQLYVDSLAPAGQGDLAAALAQLKARLAAEGLFDALHKQPLPAFPKTIGVVTSISGAVLRDIYHVSKRRNPAVQLALVPVQVQGDGAAGQIAAAIRFFNEHYPVDVLIVGRGGGSMEDLWAFNEEVVVRAIYASRIPVISAVGHETDFTLADEAADVRAATPSQAAELAVPDTRALAEGVAQLSIRLRHAAARSIEQKRAALERLTSRPAFQQPASLLAERQQTLDQLVERFHRSAKQRLDGKRQAYEKAAESLELLSPIHVLRRGYTVVERDGVPVSRVKNLATGEAIDICFADGTATAEVTGTSRTKLVE